MKPKRGFRQWVRKVEGLPEPKKTPSVEFYYHGDIDDIDFGCLLFVLEDPEGNFTDLGSIFTWDLSPQGYSYWSRRSNGEVPISVEDIEYLKYLVELYEGRAGQQFEEAIEDPW